MGTSLTGLTPSTTYDALIKVGDNGALSATAKVLSDGLGNDSVLSLSTTAVGIGTNAPTTALEVAYNSSTLNGILINQLGAGLDSSIGFANGGVIRSSLSMNINTGECRWNNMSGGYFPTIYASGVERMRITNGGLVGINEATPTARLQVKGSGSTSATTSLLVQNNAGTAAMTVKDDRNIFIGDLTTADSSSAIPQIANTKLYFNSGSQIAHYITSTQDGGTGDTSLALCGLGTGGGYFGGIRFFTSSSSVTPVLAMFVDRNQSVGIGLTNSNNLTVNASAKLQIDSTTRGFLPPRMTTTQKNAIATPSAGLIIYDSTLAKLCVYTTAWETVTSV